MLKKHCPPILLANWKMNQTKSEIDKFFEKFYESSEDFKAIIGIAPPSVYIEHVKAIIKKSPLNLFLGSQNVHWEEKGAFTGEISPKMLNDFEVNFSIIGHSERRTKFNETNETVNLRTKSAINHGLTAVVCVGESLDDYKQGNSKSYVLTQLEQSLSKLKDEKFSSGNFLPHFMIAYEPIWAIGTGISAKPEEANHICKLIKEYLTNEIGYQAPVLYGGSTDDKNIESLYAEDSIDGFLIGNASLNPETILKMLNIVEKQTT